MPRRAAEVHFIGQLQTNKVRQIAGLVDVYETVDRERLAHEIARRDPGARVLMQVDTTGEPGKGGCPLADVDALVAAVACGRARPARADDGRSHRGRTRGGAGRLPRDCVPPSIGWDSRVCSMGMTDDLEVAVAGGQHPDQGRNGVVRRAPDAPDGVHNVNNRVR